MPMTYAKYIDSELNSKKTTKTTEVKVKKQQKAERERIYSVE